MTTAAMGLALAVVLTAYAYAGYPALLYLVGRRRSTPRRSMPARWPRVTIIVPAYNEEGTIAATIENLLRIDYPGEQLEILVVSDASTDRTDEIVRSYAAFDVRLLRLPERKGKTAAENAGRRQATGEIIVNTDASVRVPPNALKPLIAAFADPTVAVASGRDVSVAPSSAGENDVEGGYVGYEMWVRSLETRAGGIIGSSGCFFATRASALDADLPAALSWDFAAALVARERGFRAVSVAEAVCHVPRTSSLRQEYRRKVRTIARGMQTLTFKRRLLDPTRYGAFAWMLFSHKVCRWLMPWAMLVAVAAVASIAPGQVWARLALVGAASSVMLALAAFLWPAERTPPRVLSLVGFLVAGNAAVIHATFRALFASGTPTWEPTRRPIRSPSPVG